MTNIKAYTDVGQSKKLAEILPLESKVEPKFKVGEWIIKNNDSPINIDYICCKITKVENGNYTIESIYGYKGYNTFETFEKDYHLWTIQDAKDGDVLACKKEVILFKSYNDNNFCYYCWYNGQTDNFHSKDSYTSKPNLGIIAPATKEQRDLLFQKMKEAGEYIRSDAFIEKACKFLSNEANIPLWEGYNDTFGCDTSKLVDNFIKYMKGE